MNRWIVGMSGCLLLTALAGAAKAAVVVAPACPGRCAADCSDVDARWPEHGESPRGDARGNRGPCAADAGDTRLFAPPPVQPRKSPRTCPPWRDCPPPPAPRGDIFQRFDDTARERLRPLPAPPIRG